MREITRKHGPNPEGTNIQRIQITEKLEGGAASATQYHHSGARPQTAQVLAPGAG